MSEYFHDTPPGQTRDTQVWQHFQGWNHMAQLPEKGIRHKGILLGYDPLGDMCVSDRTTLNTFDPPTVRFTRAYEGPEHAAAHRALAQVHTSLQHENMAFAMGQTSLTQPFPRHGGRPWLVVRTGNGNTFAIKTTNRGVHLGFIPTFTNQHDYEARATRVIIPAETPYQKTYGLWLNVYDAVEKGLQQHPYMSALTDGFRRPPFLLESDFNRD